MAESRNQTRAGCLVHGQISAPELPDPIDCTIWDVSPEGARLILPEGASVPDEISISNPFSLNPREVEVCWRGGNEVGIRLLGEAASASEPVLAPGMGGLEMIRQLRNDPRHYDLPVVVVTGRDDMSSIDLAYEAGATSFVTKPVNWRLMSYQLR